MEEKPLNHFELSSVVGERIIDKPELPKQGFAARTSTDTETIEGEVQLKVGRSRGFTVHSDEPPQVGGTGKFPTPMAYLEMGIGF